MQAFTSGGFVVAWTEDTGNEKDVVFQMFDADGTASRPVVNVASTSPRGDNNNEPAIAPLEDGRFVIVYDKDSSPLQIRGQRFDAESSPVGEDFLISEENGNQIDATTLPDGLVAVSYRNGENIIKTVIVDGECLPIVGTGGVDTLTGTDGSDVILAGEGNDRIWGRDGDDQIDGGLGNDRVNGNAGQGLIEGAAGDDTLAGGQGDDTLSGGDGNDIVRGGKGNDELMGGAGSDMFVFKDSDGANVVGDFDALDGDEVIDLGAVSAITDFADLAANHMAQSGQNVAINDGDGTTVMLLGVDVADLDTTDFLL